MSRARRTDSNLSEIVEALRACGILVYVRNDDLGDIDCQYAGRHQIFEVKTATGKLTPSQEAFRKRGWHIPIISSVDDAMKAAKRLRARALSEEAA